MSQTEPAAFAFDDVVIDFAGRRLLRGGVEQPLEPKVFGVLALLAGTPGRVFTRDEILDAVWGHRHVTPGVLNRAATLLRQALGEDAQRPRLLHTVHGTGYRFELPAVDRLPAASPMAARTRRLPYVAAILVAAAGLAIWRVAPDGTPGAAAAPGDDAGYLRRYLDARALLERSREADDATERSETAFRTLIRERPDDPRAHVGLMLALDARAARRPALAAALRDESLHEAAVVERLDPDEPMPGFVRAQAACRENRWDGCLAQLERTMQAAADFPPARDAYATALARLGHLDRAEAVYRESLARLPDNPGLLLALGRLLDVQGRHDDAQVVLARGDALATYARWFNAVWRRDHAAALDIAQNALDTDADRARLKPVYVAVSRALAQPALWPQAKAEIRRDEEASGRMNVLRVLAPDASASVTEIVAGFDRARANANSAWDLLLWAHDLAWLRQSPVFQGYLRDNGILAHWQRHGFPTQCRPAGNGADCD